MNTGTWTLVAWAVLVLAPFVTGAFGYHVGRHHERTEGKHRRTSDTLDREWEEWRAQVTAPDPWDVPEIRAKTGPLPLIDSSRMPVKRTTDITRTHVTAPDLAPVIVPEPGTFKPQPGGTGPHTTRIPKLTDTGEIRALTTVTDAWLEGMRQKGLIT